MIGATIPQVGLPCSLTHSSDNLLIAGEPWVFFLCRTKIELAKTQKRTAF